MANALLLPKQSRNASGKRKSVLNKPFPPFAAADFPAGTRRRGKDGRMWQVTVSATGEPDVCWWTPVAKSAQQEDCIRTFVRYEKRHGNKTSIVQGRLMDDEKSVWQEDYSISTPIPVGYRRVKVNREWLIDTFCQPPVDLDKLKARGSVAWTDWIVAMRKKYVTIRDLVKWHVEKRVRVLVLHRNIGDVECESQVNPRGRAIPASKFFRTACEQMTLLPTPHTIGQPLSASFKPNDQYPDPMHLHVEYKPGFWYPLDDNGYLPARDPQTKSSLLGRRVHWTELPRSTCVGFRGPMMCWADVLSATPGKVHWL